MRYIFFNYGDPSTLTSQAQHCVEQRAAYSKFFATFYETLRTCELVCIHTLFLLYWVQYCTQPPPQFEPETIHTKIEMFLASLMVSRKAVMDLKLRTSIVKQALSHTLRSMKDTRTGPEFRNYKRDELNTLELKFCKHLNWKIVMPPEFLYDFRCRLYDDYDGDNFPEELYEDPLKYALRYPASKHVQTMTKCAAIGGNMKAHIPSSNYGCPIMVPSHQTK